MDVRARRALLALVLWALCEIQAVSPQHTVADVQDLLRAPTSQQYSIYILPESKHGENLQKRQADYTQEYTTSYEEQDEPLPEPEPTNKADEHNINRGSSFHQSNQDANTGRDPRYIQHDSTNSYTNIPGISGESTKGNSRESNYGQQDPLPNIEILSFQPNAQRPNFQYEPDMALEVPPPMQSVPFYITSFDPKLQPGYGHDEELEDKMDSYAVLDESSYSTQGTEPPTVPTETYDSDYDTYEPTPEPEPTPTQAYGQGTEKPRISKKLLDNKPKKVMKVIKANPEGEYVPQDVQGVMVKTFGGEEEAFVPADLLEDTEKLLSSASAQRPSFARPDTPQSQSGQGRGMPYEFGWIVDDEATANYQTRQERGDSNGVVTGCYQVLDPNGLVRTVIYRADENGFRVLSLSRGPDKTPCPGLDDATRSPLPTQAPTPRPSSQPRPTFASVGGFSNANQAQSNQNSFSQSSQSSSSSSSSSSSFSSSSSNQNSFNQANQFSAFSGKNGLFEQPPIAKTFAPRPTTPPPRPTAAANQYNLQGSAHQAWMSEYLQNITKNLYNSYTNSSTVTNTNTFGSENSGGKGLVNFPFVLIPITTFLDLQKTGAIGKDVQSYGAFVQPQFGQSQLSQYLQQQDHQQQQQQQRKQKARTETTQHTTFNTYNASSTESQQKSHKSQGVNTVNYQINGIQQQGREGAKQRAQQQQYQNQQSSQSSQSSSSSSSKSSSSRFQSNFAGNQGGSSGFQFNQARPTASSYGTKPKPGVPGLSYGPPPRANSQTPPTPRPVQQRPVQQRPTQQRPIVNRPTQSSSVPRPVPQRPIQPRPSAPVRPRPTQSRPSTQQRFPQPRPTQNFAQPPLNNRGFASFSSQNSQSSQESQSSQQKQSSSSSSKFGNGLASQSFQSSSSKSDKSAKKSQSSSSSQFSSSGAGGNSGNQFASSSKSSSSLSSSSSSSSSQQSFNSFNSAGSNSGLSFPPPYLTQGFPGLPEPRPSSSSLSPTFVSSSAQQTAPQSGINFIPETANNKPVSHQLYQEEPIPVVLEEQATFGSPDYQSPDPTYIVDYDSDSSFLPPAPEPDSENMKGWVPLTGNFNPNVGFQNAVNIQQNNGAQQQLLPFHSAEQFNPPQLPNNSGSGNLAAGNSFQYSSSSQSSNQQQSSSQQSQQHFSSSLSNAGPVNPQQFFSKANQQFSSPSQKQPRQLPHGR